LTNNEEFINEPPNKPTIIGPTSGKIGDDYNYSITATDPDGDTIYYWVQWGEGCPSVEWTGPFASGETITLNNTWNEQGTYTIRVQARDTVDEVSEVGTLEIRMPKTYNSRLRVAVQTLFTLLERLPVGTMLQKISRIFPFITP
jgi:hypothetical protein